MIVKRLSALGSVMVLILILTLIHGTGLFSQNKDCTFCDNERNLAIGCTDILVGKEASIDGSVINSHTGCAQDSRVHVVPAKTFSKGDKASVYWGILDATNPLRNYGKVIGHIPQAQKTYAYIHSGYPHINEHQLCIAETTINQRSELRVDYDTAKQIITIEQAQLFAMERCKTARDALDLITSLVEQHGFLPSCCGLNNADGEALCIADPNEMWILEVFSVGKDWTPGNGKLGAIWAAQRVPDDHIAIVPNTSRIREIDTDNPDYFRVSKNYKQVAKNLGWYDPGSGKPFIWQETFAPPPTEGNMNRIWLFHKIFAPSARKYHTYDPIHYYPFSFKPEKKVSVQDVIAFQRSTFEGTIFDMTADLDWLVSDGKGGFKKSPMTTPFPTRDMRELLDITWHRNVAQGGYGMVTQLRSWLPDSIGGVYWFYLDNQHISTYVPIYAGVQKISSLYNTFDPLKFDENSAFWVIDFVDNLLYLKWQEGMKDVREAREPLEAGFFKNQPEIEAKALELHKNDPMKAKQFLTQYTKKCMEDTVELYRDLRYLLITKYTNNKQGIGVAYRGDDFEYAWPK